MKSNNAQTIPKSQVCVANKVENWSRVVISPEIYSLCTIGADEVAVGIMWERQITDFWGDVRALCH